MTITRLIIKKGDADISDDIEMKYHKSNPFGWSQCELHYSGERIGFLESGQPDLDEGFTYEIINEDK